MPIPKPGLKSPPEQTQTDSCESRDTTAFQKYLVKNPPAMTSMLVKALSNLDLLTSEDELSLKMFKKNSQSNECVFSYPNSDWYSIYFIEPNGTKYYYYDDDGKPVKLYFKVKQSSNGWEIDEDQMQTETPEELLVNGVEKSNCVVVPAKRGVKAKCVSPENVPGSSTEPLVSMDSSVIGKLTKVPKVPKSTPVDDAPGPSTSGGNKPTLTRSEFEKMSIYTLLDWMITNMKPHELMACIRKYNPDYSQPLELEPEEAAVRAIRSFPEKTVDQLLKEVTATEIKEYLNDIPMENGMRYKSLLGMCKRLNYPKTDDDDIDRYSVDKDYDGNWDLWYDTNTRVSQKYRNALIDGCAEIEAQRLKEKILQLEEELRGSITSTGDDGERYEKLLGMCKKLNYPNSSDDDINLYTVKKSNDGNWEMFYDGNTIVSEYYRNKLLKECPKIAAGKMGREELLLPGLQFGKRKGNRTKLLKNCKGKKKTLKKNK